MKSKNNMTEDDLRELVLQMHKVGSKPKLKRAQKRAMLSAILPKKPLLLHLAPAFAAAFAAGVLIISGISFAAQPGDPLYNVKRQLEDVRATVQPSYNETLLQKRNNEIENLNKHGADDAKLDIANKEKQEIEDRIKSSDESSSSQQTSTQQSSGSTGTGTESHTSGGDHVERDKCRAALDARKSAGENIKSDMYKACDNLDN